MKYRELHNYLEQYNFGMHYTQIAEICRKFGDYTDENLDKEAENDENEAKQAKSEVNVTLGKKRGRGHVKTSERVLKKPLIEPNEVEIEQSKADEPQIDEKEPINDDLSILEPENDDF